MSEISTLNGYRIKDKKAIRYYNTVANMIADTTLKSGMHVKTSGYYENHDGGHAEYKIISSENVLENDFIEDLSNGLKAKLIIENNIINVKQIGAKADNETDNTSIFQSAINKIKNVFIPDGTYVLNNSLILLENMNLIGQSPRTILVCNSDFNIRSNNEDIPYITIKNLRIEGNANINGLDLSGDTTRPFTGGRYSTIENVIFVGFNVGVQIKGVWATNFNNCRFIDNIISVKQLGTCNNITYNQCIFNGQDTYETDNHIGVKISADGGAENYNITFNQCDFEKLKNAIYSYSMVDLTLNNLYVEKVFRVIECTNSLVIKLKGGIYNTINYLATLSSSGSNFLAKSSIDLENMFITVNAQSEMTLINNHDLRCSYKNIYIRNKGTSKVYICENDKSNYKYNYNSKAITMETNNFNARYTSSEGKFSNNLLKGSTDKFKVISPNLVFKSDVTLENNASVYGYINNEHFVTYNINAGSYSNGDTINPAFVSTSAIIFDDLSNIKFKSSNPTTIDCNLNINAQVIIGEMTEI